MTPEMQEVRDYVGRTIWADATIMRKDVLDRIDEIENRTLPQRVAEILEKMDHEGGIIGQPSPQFACKIQADLIAQALRSGDTSEIEKWMENEHPNY